MYEDKIPFSFDTKTAQLAERFPELLPIYEASMEKIIERNQKYTPENIGRFWNFERQAVLADKPVEDVFMFALSLKLARLQAGFNEAEEDSVEDSIIDLANYALLFAAWRRQKGE